MSEKFRFTEEERNKILSSIGNQIESIEYTNDGNMYNVIHCIESIIQSSTEQAGDGWISVEDGLPENGETLVLCYAPDQPIDIIKVAYYDEDGKYFIDNEDYSFWPTHWQPLPKAPNAK